MRKSAEAEIANQGGAAMLKTKKKRKYTRVRPRPQVPLRPESRGALTFVWLLLVFSAPVYAGLIWLISVKQVHARDCPIVLDLNGNGEIDVTGLTTSSRHVYSFFFLPKFIDFDLQATGEKRKIGWIEPKTDGFLLDMRRGVPSGEIDGSWLFANTRYETGFEKLKEFDKDFNGQLEGDELSDLALWLDNGDGLVQDGEIRSLKEYGIESIPTSYDLVPGAFGGSKMAAYVKTNNGTSMYMEDVWFLSEDDLTDSDRIVADSGML